MPGCLPHHSARRRSRRLNLRAAREEANWPVPLPAPAEGRSVRGWERGRRPASFTTLCSLPLASCVYAGVAIAGNTRQPHSCGLLLRLEPRASFIQAPWSNRRRPTAPPRNLIITGTRTADAAKKTSVAGSGTAATTPLPSPAEGRSGRGWEGRRDTIVTSPIAQCLARRCGGRRGGRC
jgi:hypothetical protein